MRKPRVGLLPLYLELYDNAMPEIRPRMHEFFEKIASKMQRNGTEVVSVPICRLDNEFAAAVRFFEEHEVDGIVTLHLAYSPSLESAAALSETKLPIVVLDTTPTSSYGPGQDPAELMYNHGIHGVQDLCNVLIRNGKLFHVEAGHWEKSDVLERIAAWARSARAASAMTNARVGRIGEPFKGMGDFAVDTPVLLSTTGVQTIVCDLATLGKLVPPDDDPDVDAELADDSKRFVSTDIDPEVHRKSIRAGLAVRRWIEKENLSAFSMNFLAFDRASGVPTVPFLEASKAMQRGIGYAGEGDVLTAALVGALASINPATTFTEMFCPDWDGNSIYLSHMGEMNLSLAHGKPVLREMPFPWADADNPVFAVGRFRAGEAALVDLAPGPDDTFTLIIAPVKMRAVRGKDNMKESIHGWFEPCLPVADFLAEYSLLGGTHHCALVYDEDLTVLTSFGEIMGWRVAVLG